MADAVLTQGQTALKHHVRYTHKIAGLGRRYASGAGGQKLSRRARMLVLPDGVQEENIANAIVSLITEVVPKMRLDDWVPLKNIRTWYQYPSNTETIRSWMT